MHTAHAKSTVLRLWLCTAQAEGDEVAARLLATRRETMRLRSKIKELKQQHTQLQEMNGAQQQQLQLLAMTGSLKLHDHEAHAQECTSIHAQHDELWQTPHQSGSETQIVEL